MFDFDWIEFLIENSLYLWRYSDRITDILVFKRKRLNLFLQVKSGKYYCMLIQIVVYQWNSIINSLLKKQHRNKISILRDSSVFVFHLILFLVLGHTQSVSKSNFPTIDFSYGEYRSAAHRWIVAAKREKDGLWSLPHIFIETCILRKCSCFYKTIGIWKGKYAYLNIVYFNLAYIRLMHKLN